ncbi:mannosyltransferase [Collibacillus ludicampi]|uniref:Mannosyltransferase n=1 Tax=Collibacillus ludicampi TaxID=2771369 RepID=A0AAV4LFM5_9BACL|nr:glycosyltransferase family 39 protein [Collibacillus ludicampi]GIM46619.1 mannosyltransferase [Collibacillus ludicampi]
MSQVKTKFKWHYFGLAAILLFSVILNFYKLGQEGYGNPYYSAAVKSMLQSWHNFFFNSFDPKGFITIDKPPVGFWIQTLSAYLFGFKGWSLFLPQALAGVLSVALLYHLVARVFGRGAGLLAALFLASTPIVVAADRTNEIDSMLMFVTLIATWALSHAVERGSLKWLLLAAFLVGVGFNIKMMEAYLVLPAFYLFYLISPTLTRSKKLVHLLYATVVLAVVSCSWAVTVDSIPSDQRPYIGSTQHNSVVELAIGYNGINRLLGNHMPGGNSHSRAPWNPSEDTQRNRGANWNLGANQSAMMASHGENSRFAGDRPANVRDRISSWGNQTGTPGMLRLFINHQLAGQLSWLLPWVFFSVVALLWGTRFRAPLNRKQQAAIFWTAWVLTMTVFFSVAGRFSSYYMVMLAPGIAALAGAGFMEMWDEFRAVSLKAWLLPVALVCTTAFEISVVWNYPALRNQLSSAIGILTLMALIGLFLVKKLRDAGQRTVSLVSILVGLATLLTAPTAWAITPIQYGGSVSHPFAGPELKNQREEDLMTSNTKLENYLKANYREGTYLLATLNAMSAAPIILDTGLPVMAMGGFMGNDPALTVEKLQKMVNEGQVRYFLIPAASFGNQQTAVLHWIQSNCRVVPADKWKDQHSGSAKEQGRMGFMGSQLTLYEYVKK